MNPIVSVVMANYNGERHLADALRSVLTQSLREVEILLVDDASTDRSLEIATDIAATDPRLKIRRLPRNVGPAAARNHALAMASGKWIAVVDSDDFIHPERLERLVKAAESENADIVADDMVMFHDDHVLPPARVLSGSLAKGPSWVTPAQYILSNRLFVSCTTLGYLKPLIRASFLKRHSIGYAEDLRIAEDYDLILRLLVRGARFRVLPDLLYFYRRHGQSVSHRLSLPTLQAMIVADARFRSWAGDQISKPLGPMLDARCASIRTAAAVENTIASLKAGRVRSAIVSVLRQPTSIRILGRLLAPGRVLARMRRVVRPSTVTAPTDNITKTICVLSRQRLTAGSSGSSAYLLSLCHALRDAGFRLHLICPSPGTLGRVPIVRIAGDGDVFDRVAIRGTRRIGRYYVARDPAVFIKAVIGTADRLARRIGVTALSSIARRAPYAVGQPWTPEELLFVATEARGQADIVLSDYAFLTPGIPYALRPDGASAVLMHDLFSARPGAFASLGATDSVAVLDEQAEAALLARADLVIAIQHEEAAIARRMLPPGSAVVVAPMAIATVPTAQPGEGAGLLFVGSATAPNVDGIEWFLDKVWPAILAAQPDARLNIAGTVCSALVGRARHPRVTLLGRVADLAPHYRSADVVISPLRVGSGLKIKLVEALANGKAVVATTITAQGVGHLLGSAVCLADTAEDFAEQVVKLLRDPVARIAHAGAAHAVARRSFSASAAYRDVIDHLRVQHVQAEERARWAA